MRKLNPEHLNVLYKLISDSPYFQLLTMKLVEMDYGYCKMVLDLEKKHHNPFGGIHGGVYASLLDTATYCSVYCDLEEDDALITLNLSVDYLSVARSGRLIVEGKKIKVGKTICLAEAAVKDEEGKLLAHGKSSLLITESLQSTAQAMQVMGYKTMPKKFLD